MKTGDGLYGWAGCSARENQGLKPMLKRLDDEFIEEAESAEGVSVNSDEIAPSDVSGNAPSPASTNAEQEEQEEIDAEGESEDSWLTSWLDNDKQAFLVSLMVHVALILALATVPFVVDSMPSSVTFDAPEMADAKMR